MAEWRIKRGEEEFIAPDTVTLQEWAKSQRVRPDDYVFNPTLQRWMYARDAAELQPIFTSEQSRGAAEHYNQVSLGLGCLGVVLLFVFWPAGVAVLVVAVALSAMYYVKR
jgi:hypothetical protein